jgi:hypothetical protein
MKAKKFDQDFDAGVRITGQLDLARARRVGSEAKRVNVDFPGWMVQSIDREANRLGVTRQSLIKMWMADKLGQQQAPGGRSPAARPRRSQA